MNTFWPSFVSYQIRRLSHIVCIHSSAFPSSETLGQLEIWKFGMVHFIAMSTCADHILPSPPVTGPYKLTVNTCLVDF